MRIGMVGLHSCIREQKMGWQLCQMGHTVHIVGQQISAAHTGAPYDTVLIYDPSDDPDKFPNVRQLQNSVKLLDPQVDLFHIHNEPNWLFRAVKDVTNKPIIFDIHDWTSLRKIEPPPPIEIEFEKQALAEADGFCVPSKGYLNRLREITDKPSVLVYSMVPSFLFPAERKVPPKPGIVYEGGVKGKNDFRYNYGYRNWAAFAKEAIKDIDGKFYFYTANMGEDFAEYEHPQIEVYPPMIYPELLNEMTAHSVGIVGAPFHVGEFDDAMPNKLFEYISSGIPCIIINASEATRYAEEHGVGVGIRDASEIPDALKSLSTHRMWQDRWEFTMDSQIPKLIELYRSVLCKTDPRVIAQT